MFREIRRSGNFAITHETHIGNTHKSVAKGRRANNYYKSLPMFDVTDAMWFPEAN